MFYGTQVLWPNHCIQGSIGAEIPSKTSNKKGRLNYSQKVLDQK